MANNRKSHLFNNFGLLFAYYMAYILSYSTVAQAQSKQQAKPARQASPNEKSKLRNLQPIDLRKKGSSRNRKGKGSKGSCDGALEPQRFMVLMPPENPIMTTQSTTIFWLYIPYQLNNPFALHLEIWDGEGKQVYESEAIDIKDSPGIVGLMPSMTTPLFQTNQSYDWSVTILCEDPQAAAIPGIFKRIRVQETLETVPASTQTWYDQLTSIGQQRCQNLTDPQLASAWSTLLSHPKTELSDLAEEPFVGCLQTISK